MPPKIKWSNEEIEFLKNNYNTMTRKEIALAINKKEHNIKAKVKELGIRKATEHWSDEEIEFVKLNRDKMSLKDIAKHLNRTHYSVQHVSKKFEEKAYRGWSKEDEQFLKNNYEIMTYREIADKLGKTFEAVENKGTRLSLEREQLYNFNHDFFETIDTQEKAYWLGFFYADGYVIRNKEKRIMECGIELQKSDIYHLYKFNRSINGNCDIVIRHRKPCDFLIQNGCKKEFVQTCRIRVYSKKMCDDLIKHGCIERKTSLLKFPNWMDKKLLPHFIRGYIDGDGSIIPYENTKNNNKNTISLVGASEDFINDIYKILHNIANRIEKLSIYKRNLQHYLPLYSFAFTKKSDVLMILNYLYKDANIYLDRKYRNYQKIISYYNVNESPVEQ